MTLVIRPAVSADAALVADLVRELAAYESLDHEAVATPADFAAALFGPAPRVFCDIAEWDGAPAGLALWFYNFSTFVGRHGIYLEDLFVRPEMRGHGIGKALLARLARRCVEEGLGRLDWQVLDWNEPSIRFYEAQGAEIKRAWLPARVSGDALAALAASA
ncbi:GNAT family N-acetyltransferase [Methylobrevis albus]|uniref:GNAT family N-acetyltransferase n=1 Tax=Methylobrevis albus TaxID=2793297 RepID=A0A931HZS3_9HYPH|nr:GNAT family N-acetyltransferase [Methylobrevis albus]MBH0236714.1 GNAT family N-acetyltransferase [Methylobrevis albus]